MNRFWIKTSPLIKKIFSSQVWDIPNTENKVFLTFDDGPTPEITEWVLALLKENDIKATFFCIGDNIRKHPDLFSKLLSEGHSIGNHTFNHLHGWKTSTKTYLENTLLCEEHIQKHTITPKQSRLFRPPYGKIKPSQASKLRKMGYQIIMWDVISGDFDIKISPEECLNNVLQNTTSGSIIVFHDSTKASTNLKYVLPKVIQELKNKGFQFAKID
ncbi:polysaccharide deacetylase family protein [Flavobacterium sp.]|uniref:polysaccharide deacetylase family protein n=1 Tax=Flavobacterium sp. TaxID=239 RepID=UPI0028BE58A4|nr:polysaccharide deacetylase family protein [Flavobacterium sp.]